ncbi:MAG: D-sedoheptulose 7-phosphate isomerase [Candidatus Omnitrophica bacterium]|nr:D-sedoheptulose 7-phosphate isomerase [Candidatus Omnitrophota bacterium]
MSNKAVLEAFRKSIGLKKAFLKESGADRLLQVAQVISQRLKQGYKVLLCGNGGSAADCQHWVGEMVGRFRRERKALPFISLTTNTSILTSIANDTSYQQIFSRQVEAIGQAGDVLVCISTSGRSANVLQAAKKAREKGLLVISLTGKRPILLASLSDLCLVVPSSDTPRIQEVHILLIHILCDLVETAFGAK